MRILKSTANNPEYIYHLYQRGVMSPSSIIRKFHLTECRLQEIIQEYRCKYGFKKDNPADIDIAKILPNGAQSVEDNFELAPEERKRLNQIRCIKKWKWKLVCFVNEDNQNKIPKFLTLKRLRLLSEEYDYLLTKNRIECK